MLTDLAWEYCFMWISECVSMIGLVYSPSDTTGRIKKESFHPISDNLSKPVDVKLLLIFSNVKIFKYPRSVAK